MNPPLSAVLETPEQRIAFLALTGGQVSIDQPIVAVEIAELLTREFPPMDALLAPWLRKQHLAMVYAKRGVGKTYFALWAAYAVASGGQFLNWRAEKPRKILYIDGEMPGAAMKERLGEIVKANDKEPPEGYFRIVTPDIQTVSLPDLGTARGQEAIEPLLLDAELIVLDNLSTLCRAGPENEGESWLPVAAWALRLRKEGRAVLFVHHAGKGGQQRGSSRREDLLDTVINLQQPADYVPEKGACFMVRFEKSRGLHGESVKDVEASLITLPTGVQQWICSEAAQATQGRVVELKKLGMSDSEIANEMCINRSTVYRAKIAAEKAGLLPKQADK
jgi:hypothetical protein